MNTPSWSRPDTVSAAAAALDAFAEQARRSGNGHRPDSPGDPSLPAGLVYELLNALMDYSRRRGVDFHTVLTDAIANNATTKAHGALFKPGDPVAIKSEGHRNKGVVVLAVPPVGMWAPARDTAYVIRIPGRPELATAYQHQVEPARGFPKITTRLYEISCPVHAETELVAGLARTQAREGAGLDRHDGGLTQRQTLLGALTDWYQIPASAYLEELTPRVQAQAELYHATFLKQSAGAPPPHPVRLAASDFPHQPGGATSPTASSATADTPRPPQPANSAHRSTTNSTKTRK